MKRRLINLLKAVVFVAIATVLFWYGITTAGNREWLAISAIALTALGVAYSVLLVLSGVAREVGEDIMVLARYINQHLLEPLKEQQREEGRQQGLKEGLKEGRQQGRKQAMDDIRDKLREQGFNLDELLPPE